MFWIRRALVLCLGVLWAGPVCAFTFSYGNLLEVKDVQNKNGTLMLPITKRKYNNVKVLAKKVYSFLEQCKKDCRYETAGKKFEIAQFRLASSREDMLIVQVDIQQEIRLTFLVFKGKKTPFIKAPNEVVFKDKKWEAAIYQQLKELAEKEL